MAEPDEPDEPECTCEWCLRPMRPGTRCVKCRVCGALLHVSHAGEHFMANHSQWGYVKNSGGPPGTWHPGRAKKSSKNAQNMR